MGKAKHRESFKQDVAHTTKLVAQQPLFIEPHIRLDCYLTERLHYLLVAYYLHAYFTGESNPIPDLELPEKIKPFAEAIKALAEYEGDYYLNLSIVIFQAERFIKKEAKEKGIKCPTRSELMRQIVLERCKRRLSLYKPQRELPGARELTDLAKDLGRWLKEEEVYPPIEERLKTWMGKAEKRLNDYVLEEVNNTSWSWESFCNEVFYRYRREIRNFTAYEEALARIDPLFNSKKSSVKEFNKGRVIIEDGCSKFAKNRGSGKKSKKP